jgi:hypothetical protein
MSFPGRGGRSSGAGYSRPMLDLGFNDRLMSAVRALHGSNGRVTLDDLFAEFPTRMAEVALAVTDLKNEGKLEFAPRTPGQPTAFVPV